MSTVITTSSVALFRNTNGRMYRHIVPRGTVLQDVQERPAPQWSTASIRKNGRVKEYLIATRVLRENTEPAAEGAAAPAAATATAYRPQRWPIPGTPAAAQRATGYRPPLAAH